MKRIERLVNGRRIHFHEDLDPEIKKRMMMEPLEIDVQKALDYATCLKEEQGALRTLVAGFEQQNAINILSIDYEDLLGNEKQTVDSVISYLGLSTSQPLYSSYEKATPNRLSKGIKNFDELAQAVIGSDLEIYLDDNSDQAS